MSRQVILDPNGNGNGKKWWKETWGKAVGSVLGALMLGLIYVIGGWASARAIAFKIATARAYEAPARVDKLEDRVNQIQVHAPQPMPSGMADDLHTVASWVKAQKGQR